MSTATKNIYRERIDFATLKDAVYSLNMQRKYPSLRGRCMDQNNIEMLLNELKAQGSIHDIRRGKSKMNKPAGCPHFFGYRPQDELVQ